MTVRLFPALLLALLCCSSAARAEGLVIKFHMQQQETDGAASSPVNTNRDYTLTLYPKIVDVRTGDQEQVYDFAGQHFFAADFAQHTITSYPLCAIPISNRLEKDARIQKRLDKQKQTNPAVTSVTGDDVQDIDIDMLFGSEGDTRTAGLIETAMVNGATSFSAGGRTLASLAVSDVAIPDTLKQSYAHFFLYGTSLHPVIDRAVAQTGAVFSTLKFTNRDQGNVSEFALTMTSTEKTAAEGPDLHGLTSAYTGEQALDAAIRISASIPMKKQQALETKINNFLEQRDPLRAALAAKEMELMLGIDAHTSATGKTALEATDTLTTATLDAINTPPRTTEEYVRHMEQLNKAKDQAPDYAYLIELFRAQQLRSVLEGRTEKSQDEEAGMKAAFQKLSNAIVANPWLTGAYCDLADAYFAAHQPRTAWILWEQAARLNPKYPGLQRSHVFEQHALKDFPEYF